MSARSNNSVLTSIDVRPFTTLTAVAAPLVRDNIDTDTIIPSREIKSVRKTGLADGLFAGWRYLDAAARVPDPDFILNDPACASAEILLAGANFGCGSSREHAVWALAEYGIRAILSPSFAPIFFDNCINNGVLPATLPETAIRTIAATLGAAAQRLTVDLQCCSVSGTFGQAPFTIDENARARLLEGLDAIDVTLRSVAAIDAFRLADRQRRPWAYLEDAT
jgi:3-isopropylmalate/(R)-2-methylmalate dehydratase small subunit